MNLSLRTVGMALTPYIIPHKLKTHNGFHHFIISMCLFWEAKTMQSKCNLCEQSIASWIIINKSVFYSAIQLCMVIYLCTVKTKSLPLEWRSPHSSVSTQQWSSVVNISLATYVVRITNQNMNITHLVIIHSIGILVKIL